jgi:hypothetical protein
VVEDGDNRAILGQVFPASYLETDYTSEHNFNSGLGDFERQLSSRPDYHLFHYFLLKVDLAKI